MALIRSIIAAAAIHAGVNVAFTTSVAECESSLNPTVISPYGDLGLYQLQPVYGKGREFLARGYTDYFDPEQQAEFFAAQVVEDQMWAWPTCARRAQWLIRTQ